MFRNNIYKILSKEDLNLISSEIKNVEENTSAEIVVSIKNKIPLFFMNDINKFALYLFNFYKIYRTKNRTGILILFILKNKKFYILGDSGIYTKINKNIWEDMSNSIVKEIRSKSLLDGIIHSINLCSKLVNTPFPKRNDDINEIENSVKF